MLLLSSFSLNFIEKFLSMRPRLSTCPCSNIVMHLIPIFPVKLNCFYKFIMLFISPSPLTNRSFFLVWINSRILICINWISIFHFIILFLNVFPFFRVFLIFLLTWVWSIINQAINRSTINNDFKLITLRITV